jgi:uncharacterized membrane protein
MHLPRFVQLHPRLLVSAAIGIATFLALRPHGNTLTLALVGWNAGSWSWIALMGFMMGRNDAMHLRRIASEEDVGALLALLFVCASAGVSLVAIVFELARVHDAPGGLHYLLAAATVAGSWIAVGLAFTSHYAHLFYAASTRPLTFPGNPAEPDYWDFLYFSFTISVAAQTSDVIVMTTSMRKLVVAHSVIGFVFNAAIIGFSINVFAGAVGAAK